MASICTRGGLDWIIEKNSSLKGFSSIGTGCLGKWSSHHPWRNLKDVQIWHLGTWFSGGLGSVRFTVGLNVLKGLFQPKWFCDSINSAIVQNLTLKWLMHREGAVGRLKEASKIVGFILPYHHKTFFMKLELCVLIKTFCFFYFKG